jgi:hypothetical protein
MKQAGFFLSIVMSSFLPLGCSVYMAGTQPQKVDVGVLQSGGMARDHVIVKLGLPTSSVKHEDGTRTDIYEFYEGSATGWKVGRATFNAIADVFTAGLWEIIATPTEIALRGDKVTARAVFDKNDIMKEFVVFKVDKQEKKEELVQDNRPKKAEEVR